jgi:hypothetical protein
MNEIISLWEITDKDADLLCEAIKLTLEDASGKARETSRAAYLNLFRLHPKKCEKMRNDLPKSLSLKLQTAELHAGLSMSADSESSSIRSGGNSSAAATPHSHFSKDSSESTFKTPSKGGSSRIVKTSSKSEIHHVHSNFPTSHHPSTPGGSSSHHRDGSGTLSNSSSTSSLHSLHSHNSHGPSHKVDTHKKEPIKSKQIHQEAHHQSHPPATPSTHPTSSAQKSVPTRNGSIPSVVAAAAAAAAAAASSTSSNAPIPPFPFSSTRKDSFTSGTKLVATISSADQAALAIQAGVRTALSRRRSVVKNPFADISENMKGEKEKNKSAEASTDLSSLQTWEEKLSSKIRANSISGHMNESSELSTGYQGTSLKPDEQFIIQPKEKKLPQRVLSDNSLSAEK